MTDYARLRAALTAGPTPGPWPTTTDTSVDAAYLAECDPDTIRALLAERDRLAADRDAEVAALDVERLAKALGVIAIEDRDRVIAGDYSADSRETHAARIAAEYALLAQPEPKP